MSCNIEYICRKSIATLHHHNVLINGEKWHKRTNERPPSTADEIIEEITHLNCRKEDLKLFNYEEGWVYDCEND